MSFNSDCMLCCRETAHSIVMDNIQQQLKPIYGYYSQQSEIAISKGTLIYQRLFSLKDYAEEQQFNIQPDNA